MTNTVNVLTSDYADKIEARMSGMEKKIAVMERFIERIDTVDVVTAAAIMDMKPKTLYAMLRDPGRSIPHIRDGGIRLYTKDILEYNLKHTVR